MLTPIVHDLLIAFATTLVALLQSDPEDAMLRRFRRREHSDAHDDLYVYLWEFAEGNLELSRLVVAADSEGAVTVRPRGPVALSRMAAPGRN